MGGIDRLDQIRAEVNYQNKEQRLNLKILLFIMDLCCYQAHCFHQKIKPNAASVGIREFKCRIDFAMASNEDRSNKSKEILKKRNEILKKRNSNE